MLFRESSLLAITQFHLCGHPASWNPIPGHKSMRPSSIICKRSTMARRPLLRKDWDAQIVFWNDLKNLARVAQKKQNRAKSKIESSATRGYPSLIHTFFLTHTIGGIFLNPEDKALYDEMLRLQGLGSNISTGVPYTEDVIMAIISGAHS
ncbi:hypothetical protein Tco_1013760, partial [Tanacetum coccineum]